MVQNIEGNEFLQKDKEPYKHIKEEEEDSK